MIRITLTEILFLYLLGTQTVTKASKCAKLTKYGFISIKTRYFVLSLMFFFTLLHFLTRSISLLSLQFFIYLQKTLKKLTI